jgi:hypothetical protein
MKLVTPVLALLCVTCPAPSGAQDTNTSSLFSSYDKLDFQLKAPFDELFARSAQEAGYAMRRSAMWIDESALGTRYPQ